MASCFCLGAAASPFYPGVPSHVPRTIHGLFLFFRWLASPWVRRPPQNFSSFKALRRHRLSSLGLKILAKLHFLFLLHFVSASHFVSVLLSGPSPFESLHLFFRRLLHPDILPPILYISVILNIRPTAFVSLSFSRCRFLVVFLRYIRYPLSPLLFGSCAFSILPILLDYSRYRPSSPVSSPCRYQSCPPSFPPYSRPCFRVRT